MTVARYSNDAGPAYFNGIIDDLRVYSRGLTDAEAINYCNSKGNDGITGNLELHLRMNEGTTGSNITTALDISGNGRDGTGTNTPTYIDTPLRII